MANNQPEIVPLFTLDQIRLAYLCAIQLWKGIDFQTSKHTKITDEELLQKYSMGIKKGITNPTVSHFSPDDIKKLIRVLSM